MKKLISLIFIVFLLSGCEGLDLGTAAPFDASQSCTLNAAYAAGVNDAKNNQNMNNNYAANCMTNQESLNHAYLRGYQFAMAHTQGNVNTNTTTNYQCVDSFGSKICGYNCVTSFNQTRCASTPDQQCIADNFGKIACGYNCVKTINTVKCARYPTENCVANNFGEAKCGVNCRIDFGQIKCDRRFY